MAGAVVFANGNVVGFSAIQFNRISDIIRGGFRPGEEEVLKEVFSPLDDGAMTFISATELSAEEYRVFCRAVERAYVLSMEQGNTLVHEELWQEVLEAMTGDLRYGHNGVP